MAHSQRFVDHADLCMFHKFIATGRPSELSSRYRYNRDLVRRKTHQSGQLALCKLRTNHGRRSFVNRSSHLFNNMYAQVGDVDVGAVTFRFFKSLVKRVVRNVNLAIDNSRTGLLFYCFKTKQNNARCLLRLINAQYVQLSVP